MVGITGIGALTGTGEPVPAERKTRERAGVTTPEVDAVSISFEAVQAAEADRLVKESKELAQNEFRQKRIEEAKRNIQEGAHRVQEIVLEIAGRITGLVN